METKEFDFIHQSSIMPRKPVMLRSKSHDRGRMVALDSSISKIDHTVFSRFAATSFLQSPSIEQYVHALQHIMVQS